MRACFSGHESSVDGSDGRSSPILNTPWKKNKLGLFCHLRPELNYKFMQSATRKQNTEITNTTWKLAEMVERPAPDKLDSKCRGEEIPPVS